MVVAIVRRLCPGEIDIFSAVMLEEGAIFNFVPSVMILSISISFGGVCACVKNPALKKLSIVH